MLNRKKEAHIDSLNTAVAAEKKRKQTNAKSFQKKHNLAYLSLNKCKYSENINFHFSSVTHFPTHSSV